MGRIMKKKKTPEERFWEKVDKNGPLILETRCWIWRPSAESNHHGRFHIGKLGKAMIGSHRWSYEFNLGPIPNDMLVCHRCDNPPCVNPGHLFLGTSSDNMKDCVQKGRSVNNRGESCGTAKLTNKQVLDIRSRSVCWGSEKRLAKEFGVNPNTICHIRKGRTWKHV